MKGLISGLNKFFTKDRIMILVIFILLSVFLLSYASGKSTIVDGYETGTPKEEAATEDMMEAEKKSKNGQNMMMASSKEQFVSSPNELLPTLTPDEQNFEALNPMSHNNPQTPDLLQAGYHIGLDTIGQTMKNANRQLRSDPVIQKQEIGPWNQSTIEPDLMRVPLEVGCSS
jgi:hypothetical protein